MRKFRCWMPVVLALLCAAAYRNTFHVPFLFDDIPAITQNPAIRRLWPLSQVIASDFEVDVRRFSKCQKLVDAVLGHVR